MRYFLVLLNLILFSNFLLSQAMSLQTENLIGLGNSGRNILEKVLETPNGEVLSMGHFRSFLDFDPDTSFQGQAFQKTKDDAPRDMEEPFLLWLDQDGNYLRKKHFHSSGFSRFADIEQDSLGNLYLAGYFLEEIVLDSNASDGIVGGNSGVYKLLIFKLNPQGDLLWRKAYYNGNSTFEAKDIELDANGNLLVVGQYWGSNNLGNGFSLNNPNPGHTAGALLVNAQNGNTMDVWATSGGLSYFEKVKVSSHNDYYFMGNFADSIALGNANFHQNLLGSIIYKVKNHQLKWELALDGRIYLQNMALDHDSLLSLTGVFKGAVSFDPSGQSPALNTGSLNSQACALVQYDSAGVFKWNKLIGKNSVDRTNFLYLDQDTLWLGLRYDRAFTFTDQGVLHTIGHYHADDALLMGFRKGSGNYLRSMEISGPKSDEINDMAVFSNNQHFYVGYYEDSVWTASAPNQVHQKDYFQETNQNSLWLKGRSQIDTLWGLQNIRANAKEFRSSFILNSNTIIAAGHFQDQINFVGAAEKPTVKSPVKGIAGNNDLRDAFLVSYSPQFKVKWHREFLSKGQTYVIGTDHDSSGNIYLALSYTLELKFEDSQGQKISLSENKSLNGTGRGQTVVFKYDALGNLLWHKKINGGNYFPQVASLDVNDQGEVLLAGKFYQSLAIVGNYTSSTGGSTRGFFAKLNSNGTGLWQKVLEGSRNVECFAIALSDSGHFYVSGQFSGTVDFDPGSGSQNLSSYSLSANSFFQKYSTSGQMLYTKAYNTAGTRRIKEVRAIAEGEAGAVYLNGVFFSQLRFDPNDPYIFPTGYQDLYLLKYDHNGNLKWVKNNGLSQSNTHVTDLVFKDSLLVQSIVSSGIFNATADTLVLAPLDSNIYGRGNMLVQVLDTGGQARSGYRYHYSSDQVVNGTSDLSNYSFHGFNLDYNYNSVLVSGSYRYANDSTKNRLNRRPDGVFDACIARLKIGPICSYNDSIVVTVCDSNDILNFPPNSYITANGCDSLIIPSYLWDTVDLGLNVYPTSALSLDSNALYQWLDCDGGFSPLNGANTASFSPSNSGYYALELISPNGCTDTTECVFIGVLDHADDKLDSELTIYPNPISSGPLNIQFPDQAAYRFLILNKSGELVLERNTSGRKSLALDLELARGIYLISIYNLNGELLMTEKLLKL